ncbi:MAG: helix-turn-helix transcriptional regulator [Micropruina sp.]|uniref:AraC family transcriptional regulator n=1 Tax=Micropruina sp. TaxID=2737536 RepID=UPI0039E3ABD1
MSKTRHDGEPLVRGYAVTHPPGAARLPVAAGWDQLVYAASGTMMVSTAAGSWTVPPARALWIPAGEQVRIVNRFRVAVRTLYFATRLNALPPMTRIVTVTGLVRELLLHAVARSPLDIDAPVDNALLTLLVDQLHQLPDEPLWLPSPAASPPIAIAAAELIRDDPARSVDSLARTVGVSQRTLERAFLAATGVTLGVWRRHARILASLHCLAAGTSVTETASAIGYSTPSAFVAAFKNQLGSPPSTYLRP